MTDASLEGTTLHVSDLEQALKFYLRIPGTRLLFRQGGRFALLRMGNGQLGLLQMRPGKAFRLDVRTADLNDMLAQVQAAGLHPQVAPRSRPWTPADFRLTDPDGNLIEFQATGV